jgi:hypothetical protein
MNRATLYIVAATEMLQDVRFQQSSRHGAVEISRLFHSHSLCQGEQTQASRCYEYHPVTFDVRLLTFEQRDALCFQNESSDVVWLGQTDFPI